MSRVEVNLRADMFERLKFMAADNGRSLRSEICHRLASTMLKSARARAAKIAVVAVNRREAAAYAKRSGFRRDEWFYACSPESATGRYVRRIALVGNYHQRKNLAPLLHELRGAELAALIDCR